MLAHPRTCATLRLARPAPQQAVLLVNPSNPTGAVFPRSVVAEIVALCQRHNLWLVADEIYGHLILDPPQLEQNRQKQKQGLVGGSAASSGGASAATGAGAGAVRHTSVLEFPELFADEDYEEGRGSAASAASSSSSSSSPASPGRARAVVISGVSKTYAMTGFRVGFLRAPQFLARQIAKLQVVL